ncbi:MAG TPA: hypothetical protein VHA11_03870 [Bryobacteraceae bacterium]|nr:hypothetical protein [Bryobacteraceae bacterium]
MPPGLAQIAAGERRFRQQHQAAGLFLVEAHSLLQRAPRQVQLRRRGGRGGQQRAAPGQPAMALRVDGKQLIQLRDRAGHIARLRQAVGEIVVRILVRRINRERLTKQPHRLPRVSVLLHGVHRAALPGPELHHALPGWRRAASLLLPRREWPQQRVAFGNVPDPVGARLVPGFHAPPGPPHFQPLYDLHRADADVNAAAVLRKIGSARNGPAERHALDPGHHGGAVTETRRSLPGPLVQPQLDPVSVRQVVAQQPHSRIVIDDQDVHRAVVVEIGHRQPAADVRRGQRAVPGRQVAEELAALVPEQERRHRLEPAWRGVGLERTTVGDGQVGPAVGIEIREGRAPADRLHGWLSDPVYLGHIGEVQRGVARALEDLGRLRLLAQHGLIQRILLRDPVRDEQVIVSIAVEVAGGQPHRAAVFGDPGGLAGVREVPAAVQVELVLGDVVRHVEIEPAVAVEIVPQRAQAAAFRILDAQPRGDLGERAAAVVAEQQVALGLKR